MCRSKIHLTTTSFRENTIIGKCITFNFFCFKETLSTNLLQCVLSNLLSLTIYSRKFPFINPSFISLTPWFVHCSASWHRWIELVIRTFEQTVFQCQFHNATNVIEFSTFSLCVSNSCLSPSLGTQKFLVTRSFRINKCKKQDTAGTTKRRLNPCSKTQKHVGYLLVLLP